MSARNSLNLRRTLQSTLGYDTIIRCTWMMAATRNLRFKLRPNQCRQLMAYIETRHRPI